MPLYEFICDDCRETTDFTCGMAEYEKKKDELVCSKCGSKKMRRRFAPTPHRWKHPDEKKLGKDIRDVM